MTYTVPPGRYSDVNSAFVQAYIDAAIAGVIDLAPETLNSLNELAAAINDDPAFYATIADQVSELNTDVTAINAALGIAENDSDVGTFSSPTLMMFRPRFCMLNTICIPKGFCVSGILLLSTIRSTGDKEAGVEVLDAGFRLSSSFLL